MRTTLDIDEKLIKKAQKLTKITKKTSLIHRALELLISKAAQSELSELAGSQKKIKK